ncbi:MAG TPA: hypothetical protein DF296_03840 [Candidatus Margulisbacteria bacterium]|nr:MAG: hypothetical protein A2X43_01215 [Candidatus Margulisbacteria bacterium GWD2_39_127]OGI05362.1 MAG: hypothetical protein A2X42_05915 [Candidatus Margulisbacteria bacterium GWF2_38_17]OGI05819.1 MAG: hypothetical protein A2X41_02775 [Candidatus Margulisbacteria bacterium GWE2_39_32]HAR62277.1 hypothetical protein [Candidatus Margulisiibacteriota bacterium]HCT84313.1 hypothetical protein [Candidatus Margulisiibacteriota bacterium]
MNPIEILLEKTIRSKAFITAITGTFFLSACIAYYYTFFQLHSAYHLFEYLHFIFSTLLILLLTYWFLQKKKAFTKDAITTQKLKRQQDKNMRELEMARLIQQSLLGDHTYITKEIKIIAHCRPAEKIGGDFYSFNEHTVYNTLSKTNHQKGIIKLQNQADRQLGICIGDVAGHGIASALIMLLAKSLLDQLMNKFSSPAKIFHLANRQIKVHTEKSDISFVTAAILLINLDNKTLNFSKAGHTDSILLRQDGTLSLLTAEGVFLGMFDNVEFEEVQIQLRPKDKIILYTDGIIETRNSQGELFGLKRLTNLLEANYQLSLEKIVPLIYQELFLFSQKQEVYDDSTVVLVELL